MSLCQYQFRCIESSAGHVYQERTLLGIFQMLENRHAFFIFNVALVSIVGSSCGFCDFSN
jgi:hypothetical protein